MENERNETGFLAVLVKDTVNKTSIDDVVEELDGSDMDIFLDYVFANPKKIKIEYVDTSTENEKIVLKKIKEKYEGYHIYKVKNKEILWNKDYSNN